MWVTTEPGTFLMTRVLLCFKTEDADPEDYWVREYLRQRQVEPKRTWSEEREGVAFEVLQYGECYLRHHTPALKALWRQGLAAHAVNVALAELPDTAGLLAALGPDGRRAALWAVAGRAVELDAVGEAEDGGTLVEPRFVREQLTAAVALAAGTRADS